MILFSDVIIKFISAAWVQANWYESERIGPGMIERSEHLRNDQICTRSPGISKSEPNGPEKKNIFKTIKFLRNDQIYTHGLGTNKLERIGANRSRHERTKRTSSKQLNLYPRPGYKQIGMNVFW